MARNQQKLINYHGINEFGLNQLEDLQLGEIAVKHSSGGTAQLIIKTGETNESTTSAIFVESAAFVAMITNSLSGITNDITSLSSSTETLETNLIILEGEFNAFSSTVVSNYATSQEVDEAIGEVYTSATTYTDEAIGEAYTSATTYTDEAIEELSGNVISYVDIKVSSVYKYKGSVPTYADLPSTDLTIGDVYNVIAASGSTPAGTNYAWTGNEWDALGGTIDLSTYATKEYVDDEIDALSATYATTGTVNDMNTVLTTHTADTTIHITSAQVASQIEDYGYATETYVDEAIDALSATYATTGTVNDMNAVLTAHTADTTIHVTSAQTEVWDAALQGFSLTGTGASSTGTQSTQCGVIANYTTGGTATLDLSEIIIDCGNW